jgi:hypothetical protein
MEAGPLGRELDEHGHRAVRLGRGEGEEAVGDLTLHHHRPEAERGQAVQALGDERRRDVVGEIGDELRRGRIERAEVELERVAPVELHVGPCCELGEARLERAVELDRVDMSGAVGEAPGQHAETGADLEHDVVRAELREPLDHAEDVLVGEEVLAEALFRADGHRSAKAVVAFASIRAASSATASPRAAASAETVWTTWAGSFGRPRTGCGER